MHMLDHLDIIAEIQGEKPILIRRILDSCAKNSVPFYFLNYLQDDNPTSGYGFIRRPDVLHQYDYPRSFVEADVVLVMSYADPEYEHIAQVDPDIYVNCVESDTSYFSKFLNSLHYGVLMDIEKRLLEICKNSLGVDRYSGVLIDIKEG